MAGFAKLGTTEPDFYRGSATGIPLNKKQFKWNGSLASLKEFWISELEDGNANSLVNINSNANSEVLKFESAAVNFYTSTKTLQIQGASKDSVIMSKYYVEIQKLVE